MAWRVATASFARRLLAQGHTTFDYTQFRYGRTFQIAWSENLERMVEYNEEDIDPDEQPEWEPVDVIALGEVME